MQYALVDDDDAIVRYQDFIAAAPGLSEQKALRWLPVETQVPAAGERVGVPIVEADRVFVPAEAMTPDELAAASERQRRGF